jgi:hypothetical protein
LDGLVSHVLSKVVILEIDVVYPRTKLRHVGKLDASGVIFKDGASKDRSHMGDWNALGLHLLEEMHHRDRITDRLAEGNVLGFGQAVSLFSLQVRDP